MCYENLRIWSIIYARKCTLITKLLSSSSTISTAGAIILKITYGYAIQGENDPFVELADNVMTMLAQITTPGAYMVDFIPARKAKLKSPSL